VNKNRLTAVFICNKIKMSGDILILKRRLVPRAPLLKTSMTKQMKKKLFWLNFWARNTKLKPLSFVLLLLVMITLHQLGIIVMVK